MLPLVDLLLPMLRSVIEQSACSSRGSRPDMTAHWPHRFAPILVVWLLRSDRDRQRSRRRPQWLVPASLTMREKALRDYEM